MSFRELPTLIRQAEILEESTPGSGKKREG
jgi:hypothetical protein